MATAAAVGDPPERCRRDRGRRAARPADGLELAREALDSGAAAARLDELVAFSQGVAA